MLVLSRRENEKVLFPNLGITVEVVAVKGKNVRLGIDAPSEIRIIRSELAADSDEEFEAYGNPEVAREERHRRNNRLNSVSLQIQVAQKLLERGEHDQALETLATSLTRLRDLEEHANDASKIKSANLRSNSSKTAVASPSLPTEAAAPKAKWKALLVEDDQNERQLMASILRMCGFEVDIAEDGMAAIDYLKTHDQPDCVLMDMQMPRLSGPETITTIREELEFRNIPIYGVSGLKRHEANVALGDRGVSGWFAKPVDSDSMLQQIFADFRDADAAANASLN